METLNFLNTEGGLVETSFTLSTPMLEAEVCLELTGVWDENASFTTEEWELMRNGEAFSPNFAQ